MASGGLEARETLNSGRPPLGCLGVYLRGFARARRGTQPSALQPESPMKRTVLSALSLLLLSFAVAFPSLAALDKYKDSEKSPEDAYLATDDEQKEWKKLAS